jgi:hypothetical protein
MNDSMEAIRNGVSALRRTKSAFGAVGKVRNPPMNRKAMSALGWELPLDVFCTKGSYAQKVTFAKSHEWPIAVIQFD